MVAPAARTSPAGASPRAGARAVSGGAAYSRSAAARLVPSQTRIVRYSMRQVSMVPLGEEAVLWEVGHLWCRRNSQSG